MPLDQLHVANPTPMPWTGKNTHGLAAPQWRPYPRLRLNDYFYPVGAMRWSIFHGLAPESLALQMANAALPLNAGPQTQTFILQTDTAMPAANLPMAVSTPMWMLPPKVLSLHNGGQGEPLYLITLVDERYYWPWFSSVKTQINDQTTWSSLIQAITAPFISQPTFPMPNPAYGAPMIDSDLYANYENAAVLLDTIGFDLGWALVRNMDGSFNFVTEDQSRSQTLINRTLLGQVIRLSGGRSLENDANGVDPGSDSISFGAQNIAADFAILPASVTVTFPKFSSNPNQFIDNRPAGGWIKDSYGDVFTINVPITTVLPAATFPGTPIANTTKVFHDTAKAVYPNLGGVGNPDNMAGLQTLANQVATDYYNWLLSGLDETYHGMYPWKPEGFHDILFSYRSDSPITRVIPRPWNFGITELHHDFPQMPVLSCCDNTPLTLHVTLSEFGGPSFCPCLQGVTFTITFNSMLNKWTGNFTACGQPTNSLYLELICTTPAQGIGGWNVNIQCGSTTLSGVLTANSYCDPFHLNFVFPGVHSFGPCNCNLGGGTNVDITP